MKIASFIFVLGLVASSEALNVRLEQRVDGKKSTVWSSDEPPDPEPFTMADATTLGLKALEKFKKEVLDGMANKASKYLMEKYGDQYYRAKEMMVDQKKAATSVVENTLLGENLQALGNMIRETYRKIKGACI